MVRQQTQTDEARRKPKVPLAKVRQQALGVLASIEDNLNDFRSTMVRHNFLALAQKIQEQRDAVRGARLAFVEWAEKASRGDGSKEEWDFAIRQAAGEELARVKQVVLGLEEDLRLAKAENADLSLNLEVLMNDGNRTDERSESPEPDLAGVVDPRGDGGGPD